MLTVIHGADFHLDSVFSGLSEEKARQRRQESRQLPLRLAALAREKKADLVLLAGDLFEGLAVYRQTLEQLFEGLAGCGCPVLIAPGNHDWYGPHSVWATATWPEQVHIFTRSAIERVEFPQLGCVVYGGAFTGPVQEQSMLTDFCAQDEGLLRLMVLHGALGGSVAGYHSITPAQIAQSRLHYLALGHVHTASGLQQEGETFWAYPGCAEGRGFDELGEKGVLLTRLDGKQVQSELVPLARRRYQLLQVDITGQDPLTAVRAVLPPTAAADICRVLLTGERQSKHPVWEPLIQNLSEMCWQLQLRDQTHCARDLWDRAGENSLRGLMLAELKKRRDCATDETQSRQIEQAARFALAALDGREC